MTLLITSWWTCMESWVESWMNITSLGLNYFLAYPVKYGPPFIGTSVTLFFKRGYDTRVVSIFIHFDSIQPIYMSCSSGELKLLTADCNTFEMAYLKANFAWFVIRFVTYVIMVSFAPPPKWIEILDFPWSTVITLWRIWIYSLWLESFPNLNVMSRI